MEGVRTDGDVPDEEVQIKMLEKESLHLLSKSNTMDCFLQTKKQSKIYRESWLIFLRLEISLLGTLKLNLLMHLLLLNLKQIFYFVLN